MNHKTNTSGIGPGTTNKSFVFCTFYIWPNSDHWDKPKRIISHFKRQDSVGDFKLHANDGKTLIVVFSAPDNHYKNIISTMVNTFPDVDMRYSIFAGDGHRRDEVYLIGAPKQTIICPLYLYSYDSLYEVIEVDASENN